MTSDMIEWIGAIAATMSTSAFLPQAIRTIQSRQTRDISLWTQALLFSGTVMWLIYGLYIGSVPLIVANIISFFLVSIVLVLKLKHG